MWPYITVYKYIVQWLNPTRTKFVYFIDDGQNLKDYLFIQAKGFELTWNTIVRNESCELISINLSIIRSIVVDGV